MVTPYTYIFNILSEIRLTEDAGTIFLLFLNSTRETALLTGLRPITFVNSEKIILKSKIDIEGVVSIQ